MSSLPPPGTGYFVGPTESAGPAVLMLPSPWGLSSGIKAKADTLADSGFTVLVPDLNDGIVATDIDHARSLLMEADMNVAASLVQSSLRLLQRATSDPTRPIGLLGYAAGASWALWLSVRAAEHCAAVAAYYGTQTIAFDHAQAAYLLHFADGDPDVSPDDIVLMGLNLQMAQREFHIEQHHDVGPGFAEAVHPNFDRAAEARAWDQTLDFFTVHLAG